MSRPVDPLVLARFLAASDATDWIEAISAVPEGLLRHSTLQHVLAIGHTYANPPTHFAPDPLQRIAPDPVAALAGPRRGTPSTDDPAVKAVQLMLEGVPPHEAAERTGLTMKAVSAAKLAAKRGGVKFPNLKASKKPKGAVAFALTLDGLGHQALSSLARAAETRGVTLDAYMARRGLALKMALEGRHIRAIMEATKESKTVLTSWFSSLRAAGHDVPYMLDGGPAAEFEDAPPPAPEPEPAAKVVKLKRTDNRSAFPLHETELDTPHRRQAIEIGASLMHLTVQQFLAKRRQAVELYREGKSPAVVASLLSITRKQASNWRSRAINAGRLKAGTRARKYKSTGRGFAISLAELTPRARQTAEATARVLNLSLEALMEARAAALGAFKQGQRPTDIARQLNVPAKTVENWKTLCRIAGLIEPAPATQVEA